MSEEPAKTTDDPTDSGICSLPQYVTDALDEYAKRRAWSDAADRLMWIICAIIAAVGLIAGLR